jgi:outer membrane protein OmpA-like peptidoglycan-associated protein
MKGFRSAPFLPPTFRGSTEKTGLGASALEIQSDTGKADIKSKYNDEIAKVADFFKKYPSAKGTIEGHIWEGISA